MQRIVVMASSSGAGKSTFARQLGERLDLPVHHLDVLFWKPGWVESSMEEFSAAQSLVVQQPAWIIEGNYTSTYAIRETRADTLIYLDVSLGLCMWRVVARRVRNHGRTRPDMAAGCQEMLDWAFLWYIVRTYYPRRRRMPERLEDFRQSGRQVVVLHGHRGQQDFLTRLGAVHNA